MLEKYSTPILSQKKRQTSNYNLNKPLKPIEKKDFSNFLQDFKKKLLE